MRCFTCIKRHLHSEMFPNAYGVWVCPTCGNRFDPHAAKLDYDHRCQICGYPMLIQRGKPARCQNEGLAWHQARKKLAQ